MNVYTASHDDRDPIDIVAESVIDAVRVWRAYYEDPDAEPNSVSLIVRDVILCGMTQQGGALPE